jgi:hypothetical protein
MKTIFNRLLYVGAAFGAMSLAPIGQAGILQSTGIYGDAVTISYNGVQTGTTAGAFLGATFNGGTIPPFWCIDLNDHVPYPPWTSPGLPDYTEAVFQSSPLSFTATQVLNVETLFSQEYAHVSSFSSTTDVAAFQLAIWDLLFDDSFHDLSTYGASGFGVVSIADTSAQTEAQAWINSAVAGPEQTYVLTQLTNSTIPPYQNFLYSGPPSVTVPEPTELALLGAGLVAMMFVTRRRRTDGHPA